MSEKQPLASSWHRKFRIKLDAADYSITNTLRYSNILPPSMITHLLPWKHNNAVHHNKEGNVHTYQNLRNAYLVIDDIYFSADSSWLASSFKDFKGDASLPDSFFERVRGITITYGLIKLSKNGKTLSQLSPLEGTYRQLAEENWTVCL
ncbi:hypothetical protein [Desulfosporosinus fructosivorans]